MKRRRKKTIKFNNYLVFLLILVTLLLLGLIYFINVLPLNYFLVLAGLLAIVNIFIIWLLKLKGKVKNVCGIILAIVLIALQIWGISYELQTLDFFKQFGFNNYKTESYQVIVLKDAKNTELNDLVNQTIGHLDINQRPGLKQVISELKKKINFTTEDYTNSAELFQALDQHNIAALIIEETELAIIKEENSDFMNNYQVIYTQDIELEIKNAAKEVNVLNEPFNIYISGIDTYGKITQVSRSDVNIIASINPRTHQILLTSIPRDYYVTLAGYEAKDKLTHAGIYGIETSIATLENLLDTEINYYVKVNFTSLISVVDALDGITVNSKYSFTSQDGYTYQKGINELNGEEALSFVRERKAFSGGDRTRGENQELVLSAIINKALKPSIIINYADLLKAVKGGFITNLTDDDITKIIKKEIDEPHNWQIESISLDGTDSYNYTYSYSKSKLYVMEPNMESVNAAIKKMQQIQVN